ncbi:U3 small nucleolar RNA-associated protein 19 [Fasciolopsis buskii]|uniref:U3 small nucleolar RNA-associated protein 19 n=1 Tax=Fasciolopsis buskii TaxID=27845 RepID=A0A8E0RKN0_9TREM|nr:U3 small nucleolar RNA-associated protein 19 [Fasciolopsis buski]
MSTYSPFQPLVTACLVEHSEITPTVLEQLKEVLMYRDATYYFLRHLSTRFKEIANYGNSKPAAFYENSLLVMQLCLDPKFPMEESLGQPIERKTNLFRYTRLSNLRHEFTQVWLCFFQAHVPDRQMIKAIKILGDGLLHRLGEIRLFSDYIIPIFDPSGVITESASESIPPIPATWSRAVTRTVIGLINRGGLNYPRLFPRLYELLDESLLMCPEVERFLVDLDMCLSSLHLAAHIVAAFLKRLSQLALISPLRLTTAFLLLVRNGLKRHIKCSVLVHRKGRPPLRDEQVLVGNDETTPHTSSNGDPYQWNPKNLTSSGVMQSSLWEVASLQHHYAFEVAHLAHQICHPKPNDPLDSTTPEELIKVQEKLIMESSKSAQNNLRVLTQSNYELPQLDAMVGWVDDLGPGSVS